MRKRNHRHKKEVVAAIDSIAIASCQDWMPLTKAERTGNGASLNIGSLPLDPPCRANRQWKESPWNK